MVRAPHLLGIVALMVCCLGCATAVSRNQDTRQRNIGVAGSVSAGDVSATTRRQADIRRIDARAKELVARPPRTTGRSLPKSDVRRETALLLAASAKKKSTDWGAEQNDRIQTNSPHIGAAHPLMAVIKQGKGWAKPGARRSREPQQAHVSSLAAGSRGQAAVPVSVTLAMPATIERGAPIPMKVTVTNSLSSAVSYHWDLRSRAWHALPLRVLNIVRDGKALRVVKPKLGEITHSPGLGEIEGRSSVTDEYDLSDWTVEDGWKAGQYAVNVVVHGFAPMGRAPFRWSLSAHSPFAEFAIK